MKTSTILLLSALGVGGYFFYKVRAKGMTISHYIQYWYKCELTKTNSTMCPGVNTGIVPPHLINSYIDFAANGCKAGYEWAANASKSTILCKRIS